MINKHYHKDPVWNKIYELENRIATLEGKEPLHKLVCSICDSKGYISEFTPRESWTTPCKCQSND